MKTIFKNTLFSFYILLIASTSLPSQVLTPVASTIMHEDQSRPCLEVHLDPEPKTLKNAWNDYLNDHYDVKLKGMGLFQNKDLLSAEEIVMPHISSNKMDFYTQIVEDENGSVMKVFAAMGYDIYLSNTEMREEFNALRQTVEDFEKEFLPIYYAGEVNDTQKRIKVLQKDKADLQQSISKETDNLEELEREIAVLKENLKTKKESLEEANLKLEKRKEKLDRIQDQVSYF